MAFTTRMKSMEPRRTQYARVITLVSGGYIKPDSFPGGQIRVYPWDSEVDDWLAKRAKKGDPEGLLFDLCAHVCDLGSCPLDLFVVGDVNTILLVSRSLRYPDSTVEYACTCPVCGYATTEEIKVPDELSPVGQKTVDYPGSDLITLPECRDEVAIRPLQVKDERMISGRDDTLKKLASDRLMHILVPIKEINGGTPDAWEHVLRWYNALPPGDAAFLEAQQNLLYPHLDTNLPHVCDKCGRHFMHPLDLSTEFFRPSVRTGRNPTMAADVQPGVAEQRSPDVKPAGGS